MFTISFFEGDEDWAELLPSNYILKYKESDGDVTGWIPSEKTVKTPKPNNLKSSKRTC